MKSLELGSGGMGLRLESMLMGLGPGSVWAYLDPGSTGVSQALGTSGIGPDSWSLGASLVLGWFRSLIPYSWPGG